MEAVSISRTSNSYETDWKAEIFIIFDKVVSSDDPRDLLLADDAVDEVGDVRDIIEEVEAQRNMLAMKTAE